MSETFPMTREQAELALNIANRMHKAVPEGTDGGIVILALAMLMGAGIRYAPKKESHDVILASAIDVVEEIVAGRIDITFASDH